MAASQQQGRSNKHIGRYLGGGEERNGTFVYVRDTEVVPLREEEQDELRFAK